MSPPDRFSVVAPLPPHGEWRRALALDRAGAEPAAVVLAFVPQSVVDDPARLAALVRDVEAAGRLHHPAAVPVLGAETLGDGLAIVEAHRPGTPLAALLAAGGRLPPDVAVRITIDTCAAIARAHALEAGDGRKLVHGALSPAHVLVADDGAALVTGFGAGGAAEPADDVRALAAVLHECLAGEPPGPAPSRLEDAHVGPALAAAVARALGAGRDAPMSASALAEAVVAAGPVASHADVASYVDAILPPREGARAQLARALAEAGAPPPAEAEEISEEFIVEPAEPAVVRAEPALAAAAQPAQPERARGDAPGPRSDPDARTEPAIPATQAARPEPASPREPTPEPLPRPPSTRPGADPAGTFAAPPPPPRRSRAPLVVGIACALVGFVGGYEAFRHVRISIVHAEGGETVVAITAPAASATPAAIPSTTPPSTPAPTSTPVPTSAATPASTSRSAAGAQAPKRSAPAPKKAAKAQARTAAPSDEAPKAKGMLRVGAPEDAEVYLDARRIGRGRVDIEIPVGAHRIEVRRGEARVAESFTLAAGETWTYDVTPTP